MIIRILYQDSFLLVCEKPVGLSSESPGLPDIVAQQTGQKIFPVHRLDTGTGGVIILACSSDVCTSLRNLFDHNLVQKKYFAVVSGHPDESGGSYTDYLYHDKKTNKSYVADKPRRGVKQAVCEWIPSCSVLYDGQELSLIQVQLHTGRTHQIRVQFGSRGFPLVGDRKYGSRIRSAAPALWASGISFPHPYTQGSIVSVTSAPPAVFPWNLFISSIML